MADDRFDFQEDPVAMSAEGRLSTYLMLLTVISSTCVQLIKCYYTHHMKALRLLYVNSVLAIYGRGLSMCIYASAHKRSNRTLFVKKQFELHML